jgi:hypothetical protein
MKIRITEMCGIVKVHLRELVRARREDNIKPPPLWTPSQDNDSVWIPPPPEGHDSEGRNRRR